MFDDLNNLSTTDLQKLLDILESNTDVNSCLSNCTNQGVCKLDNQTQKYLCECNPFYTGTKCETDRRPCSLNKCLNNSTCINSLNSTSFTCQCPLNGIYYGQYCENVKNLCENVTCSSHGYCIQSQSGLTSCKCYKGYEGDKCDIISNSLKIVQGVQWTSTIICIGAIILFWILVICNDFLNFFKICNQHIDINEWKNEKLHGKKIKPKIKKELKIKKMNKNRKQIRNEIKKKISKFSPKKKINW